MNKKGQTIILGVMWFLLAFIAAVALMTPLLNTVTDARSPSNLDCDADNITTGNSMTCVVIDIAPALFLLAVIGASLFLIKLSGKT